MLFLTIVIWLIGMIYVIKGEINMDNYIDHTKWTL